MEYSSELCLEVERKTAECIAKNPDIPLQEAYQRSLVACSAPDPLVLQQHNTRARCFERTANTPFNSLDLAILDLARTGYYDARIGAYLSHCHISPFEIIESQDTMVACYLVRLVESRNLDSLKKAFSELRHAEDATVSMQANELGYLLDLERRR